MNAPQDFADIYTAREVTRILYPDAKKITMIAHSHDNIVAIVDTSFTVRFPRNQNAYLRSLYEKNILVRLESTKTIAIPRILGERTNPPCLVTSFIPGHHLGAADVREFSQVEQQDFAKQVAQFAYTLHKNFSVDEELPLRKELALDELAEEEPWSVYFKRVVYDAHYPSDAQTSTAKKYYEEWVRLCDVTPTVVVHDDLHTQNMMFENNRLTGILDFGDTNVGTPEQDLRQLYRISEEVMLVAVQEYQNLSGHQLNVEAIKTWSIMKELGDYSKALAANKTSHHSFKRACRNLNMWLGEGDWGDGYDLSTDAWSQ